MRKDKHKTPPNLCDALSFVRVPFAFWCAGCIHSGNSCVECGRCIFRFIDGIPSTDLEDFLFNINVSRPLGFEPWRGVHA